MEGEALSFEDTARVWSTIRNNHRLTHAHFNVSFQVAEKSQLIKILNSILNSSDCTKQYITTYSYHEVCFLLIESEFCIEKFDQILEFDADGFFLYDQQLNNGFSLDFSEEYWATQNKKLMTYELRVKGADWISKVIDAWK